MKTTKLIFTLLVVFILIAAGYLGYRIFLKNRNYVKTSIENKIIAPDFAFSLLGKKIEIKDKSSGKLVQEIAISSLVDVPVTVEEMVYFKDDVNFDGYKDLKILTQTAATNEYSTYYIYNLPKNIFEEDKVLRDLAMPIFDVRTKTIKTYQTGGCAGGDFENNIYSFANGKYALTIVEEGACCSLDGRDAVLGVTVSELKNGKMEVVRTDPCPSY